MMLTLQVQALLTAAWDRNHRRYEQLDHHHGKQPNMQYKQEFPKSISGLFIGAFQQNVYLDIIRSRILDLIIDKDW
jgi:hypothetical protein